MNLPKIVKDINNLQVQMYALAAAVETLIENYKQLEGEINQLRKILNKIKRDGLT